jgi:acyl dehydratase
VEAPFFEDVEAGCEIPSLTKTPDNLQLFMFSAVTWNCHRIHYDADFARDHDGLPNVLTHRPLLGSFLAQLLTDWLGRNGRLLRLEWSNRGPAVPGDVLTCRIAFIGVADKQARSGAMELLTQEVRGTDAAGALVYRHRRVTVYRAAPAG